MRLIYNKASLEHDTGMHPENAKRLVALGDLPETEIIEAEQFLKLIHTEEYISHVKDVCANNTHLDQDTVVCKKSYDSAVKAVGATIMASQSGDFALVRPPGHHAYPDHSSGFCIFNNVAIAAQNLVNQGLKVLIFDFDGHLGDGTEKIFYDSDKVMYWSLHQFPAFPGHGDANEIGVGAGEGYTINVPLPPKSGDDIFLKSIHEILPVVEQFNPDVVAVSAGFDAHVYDLLLDLRISANTYYKIGQLLEERFKRVFATLEGGYSIEEFPKCLYNFLDGFNGEDMKHPEDETDSMIQVHDEYDARMYLLKKELSKHWKL